MGLLLCLWEQLNPTSAYPHPLILSCEISALHSNFYPPLTSFRFLLFISLLTFSAFSTGFPSCSYHSHHIIIYYIIHLGCCLILISSIKISSFWVFLGVISINFWGLIYLFIYLFFLGFSRTSVITMAAVMMATDFSGPLSIFFIRIGM
ncbi:hypothetical protein RND81_07G070800 [Saponaria officinalis]|uniref:NADH dehydrogenase subunit 6 n=1 Tax=Saponaria officinalis TaxID=3572 RepID=A0AAW1JMN9_SAPOF